MLQKGGNRSLSFGSGAFFLMGYELMDVDQASWIDPDSAVLLTLRARDTIAHFPIFQG